MKHSLPVLVASQNEDFRHLLRDMLEKNGFFHILEAANDQDIETFYRNHTTTSFSLIHQSVLTHGVLQTLKQKEKFLIVAQPDNESLLTWSAQLGIDRFMSFPFSSRRLMEKIESILQ